MDIANMITIDGQHDGPHSPPPVAGDVNPGHQYPTRASFSANGGGVDGRLLTPPMNGGHLPASRAFPTAAVKNISFELQLDGSAAVRGRLPMRVQIFPHDTTESIVTTVKNFYGLYDSGSQSVSFEDLNGKTVIASYDNLANNMTVYVRAMPLTLQHAEAVEMWPYRPTSPQRVLALNESGPMLPPQPAQILNYGQPPSRPGSRISRKQSVSPKMSQGKIPSAQKVRSRSSAKGAGASFQAGLDELNSDVHNGYSSSDGGAGSVTSSRKARSELVATAEISVDNIVEGDRRPKAKFESSELPLFVPPQVPAPNSISSISPQRRTNAMDNPSPFVRPLPHALALQPPGQVAAILGASDQAASAPPTTSPFTIPPVPAHGHRLRDRTSGATLSARSSLGSSNRLYGSNILPTPDPTIASCISDEDVALQLMRLGDASNFSHGRTSASTVDDGFSGRAELASSDTSDGESESEDSDVSDGLQLTNEYDGEPTGPPLKKQRRHTDDGYLHHRGSEAGDEAEYRARSLKAKKARAHGLSITAPKHVKQSKQIKTASLSGGQPPISPASLPPSRKASASTLNFQTQLGAGEEDLSSKPRCQRCRKSKKGCDRQRPCQRCKDAGIGIEGCISEDEGNGRKGRYGRHMGVPIKSVAGLPMTSPDFESEQAGAILSGIAADQFGDPLNKKRKR